MSTDKPNRDSIFLSAIEIAEAERPAFIAEACGDDDALKHEVLKLVAAHFQAGSFLKSPVALLGATADGPAVTERVGTVIGPYKLLQQIGEGGMGVVYMAEQQEPVRRTVALKIIKPGMDSGQVIARFESERQALAMMDHPNIAKVLDAGTTDSGRPYFVMELVKGVPITQFCDEHELTPRERLELFVPVCQAVQHAHQKGVIHRDLKPSNVLIALYDDKPVPKIIDFGVAKATSQRLTERTLFTAFGSIVGTLEYMSPEQAKLNALDIDTRSDVYALGVLLYELLTGTTPLERGRLRDLGYEEMLRLIREEEPPKPSTRLSTTMQALPATAQKRKTEAAQLTKLLRGELDWIVLKSLEKDRTRRYDTASAFARDIERYLKDEPVQAGPPSASYLLRKFVKRHRGAAMAAGLILAALVLGVVGTSWGLIEALHQREETDQARRDAVKNAESATEQEGLAKAARDDALEQARQQKAARQRAEIAEKDALNLAQKEKAAREDLRRLLYSSTMNRAYRSWQEGNFSSVSEAVQQTKSQPKGADLRGFEWNFLDRLCRPELLSLKAAGFPHGCPFSPDGKLLATVAGGVLLVWDAKTGKELRRMPSKVGVWPSIAFQPDNKAVALSGCQQGKELGEVVSHDVRVIDLETWEERWHIRVETDPGEGLAFSPNGKLLVSGPHVFDAASGKKVFSLKGHAKTVRRVALSPDGARIVSAACDLDAVAGRINSGDIKVWDAATGKELLTIKDTGWVTGLAFHPDGLRFAADVESLKGYHVKFWDAQTGKEMKSFACYAADLAFSPCGCWLATASNYSVLIWDLETGNVIREFSPGLAHVYGVAFSPDGRRLASSHRYGTVKVWDMAAMVQFGKPIPNNGGTMRYGLALSPDGQVLARTSSPGQRSCWVKVQEIKTGRQVWELKLGPKQSATDVAFHPDGDRIAVVVDGSIVVLNAKDGKERLTVKAGVQSVAFSPDGRFLAGPDQNTVRLWDALTGVERFAFKGHTNTAFAMAFSSDGSKVVSASPEEVIVWEIATSKELLRFKEVMGLHHPRSLAFSPNGKRLATPLGVRDAATGDLLFELRPDFAYRVQCVAFSSDGRRLATDGQVMLIDVDTGQTVGRLKQRNESPADMVIFSKDGHRLAAVSEDGTVQVWDATPPPTPTVAAPKSAIPAAQK